MSHVATVDVEIRDLDALDAACRRLGLELVRGQQTYRWYGRHVGDYPLPDGFTEDDLGKCDHAVRIPGDAQPHGEPPYEIGVVRRRDGRPGFSLMWDFFCGGFGLEERVGQNCRRLKQAYAVEVARKEAMRSGFRVQEHVAANGSIQLRLSK
jgi:hypothetical protein